MVAINTVLVSVITVFCLLVEAIIPPNESGLSNAVNCPSPGCKEPTERKHVRDFFQPQGTDAKVEDTWTLPLDSNEELNKAPSEALRTPLERTKEELPKEGNALIEHAKRDDDNDTQDWQDWPEDQKQLIIAVIIDEFNLHMQLAGIVYETSVEEWTALLVLREMQKWLVKESWQSVYQWIRDSQNVLSLVTAGECKMDAQRLFRLPKEWKCEEFCDEWGHC
jgi:sarcosine oxidase delta subunit